MAVHRYGCCNLEYLPKNHVILGCLSLISILQNLRMTGNVAVIVTNGVNESLIFFAEDMSVKTARMRFNNVLRNMIQENFMHEDESDSDTDENRLYRYKRKQN